MKIMLDEYYCQPYGMTAHSVWADDIKSIEHGRKTLERAAYLLWRHEKGYVEDYWADVNIFKVVYVDLIRTFFIE